MKIICPEHQGVIVVPGNPHINQKNVPINDMVVECPVCDEEVLVNGIFDYDEHGVPFEIR
jgi:hypothetical protein